MTTFTETVVETFRVVSCYTCGARFGIGGDLYKRAVTDAVGSVHCPACGAESCWRESNASRRIKELEQKLKWEADQAFLRLKLLNQAEASLKATKGVVTRMKRRTAAGVCPCCKRTFKQLAAHMTCKHPNFVK